MLLADIAGTARGALAGLLDSLDGVDLVDQVGARGDLAAAIRRKRPDVLVIDERLVLDGDHVLAKIGPLAARPRVIVVGVDDDPAFAARALRLGAEAWIAKDRAAEDLPRLLGRT